MLKLFVVFVVMINVAKIQCQDDENKQYDTFDNLPDGRRQTDDLADGQRLLGLVGNCGMKCIKSVYQYNHERKVAGLSGSPNILRYI